jgi:hypothetical protein
MCAFRTEQRTTKHGLMLCINRQRPKYSKQAVDHGGQSSCHLHMVQQRGRVSSKMKMTYSSAVLHSLFRLLKQS